MTAIPTREQIEYANEVIDRMRRRALLRMVQGEHIEFVTEEVFGYVDGDGHPTAGDVAYRIVEHLSREFIAPLEDPS